MSDSERDDRRVIIVERDSGIGWAVAFIVLAIAIGFGIIVFMDQQSMIEYKIERALQELQRKNSPPFSETSPTVNQMSLGARPRLKQCLRQDQIIMPSANHGAGTFSVLVDEHNTWQEDSPQVVEADTVEQRRFAEIPGQSAQ